MIIIKKNSKGTQVRILQAYLGVAADGTCGTQTVSAIKNLQKEANLIADGICGDKTWDYIYDNIEPIKLGSTGKLVRMWQAILGVNIDGVFSEKTSEQTRAYQYTAGLDADGIVGDRTWDHAFGRNMSIATNSSVRSTRPVDYKQYDSRWRRIKYSTHTTKQTIGNSGCGPTAMANIVATWWDSKVTPKEMAALSLKNGYRTYNSGTSWNFFKFVAKQYKAQKFVQTASIATLKNALEEGAYAVVSFRKSKWTSGG